VAVLSVPKTGAITGGGYNGAIIPTAYSVPFNCRNVGMAVSNKDRWTVLRIRCMDVWTLRDVPISPRCSVLAEGIGHERKPSFLDTFCQELVSPLGRSSRSIRFRSRGFGPAATPRRLTEGIVRVSKRFIFICQTCSVTFETDDHGVAREWLDNHVNNLRAHNLLITDSQNPKQSINIDVKEEPNQNGAIS
jgi:hypothetical protein